MRVLLVAKPWKGGLARYVFEALQDLFPGQTQWVNTYPDSPADFLSYRTDKHAWLQRRIARINASDYDCALFINHIPAFRNLCTDRNNLLWLTDAPNLSSGDCAPFKRIFLSDTGYEQVLLKTIDPARYRGELPFACHPKLHRPAPPEDTASGSCFIGNKDQARDVWLGKLIASEVRPKIYGNYFLRHTLFWQHPSLFRPAVSNTEMGDVYARHRVALNLHAAVVRHGSNMRSFECAAYGIPQVADYRNGLAQLFAPETEIQISRTPAEMAQQISALLAQPEAAAQMAQRARQRALTEHTYYHRLLTLLADDLSPAARATSLQRMDTFIAQPTSIA